MEASDRRNRLEHGEEGAGRTSVAMEPDPGALGPMRSAVAEWLRSDAYDHEVVDRVTLVASEMASSALQHCDGVHPVLVDLRHTHTLLVVDVTYHPAIRSHLPPVAVSPGPTELEVVEHLADRVSSDEGSQRVTTRSTFYVPGGA